jgi:hypothetical protein
MASNLLNRGIADMAIRCLVIAAECLETPEAQHEILEICDKIAKVHGSSSDPIKNDLKQIWSWVDAHPHTVAPAQMHNHSYGLDPSLSMSDTPSSSSTMNNPLLAAGSFSLENHPYQGFYVPPNHHHALDQYDYSAYLI